MSTVGSIAFAIGEGLKLAYAELHPSQQEQIKEAYEYSETRINEFKSALLDDRYLSCATLWDGCLPVVPASVSDEERSQLEQSTIDINQCRLTKYQWLGQFCAAESANFLRKANEIIRSTTPSDH